MYFNEFKYYQSLYQQRQNVSATGTWAKNTSPLHGYLVHMNLLLISEYVADSIIFTSNFP